MSKHTPLPWFLDQYLNIYAGEKSAEGMLTDKSIAIAYMARDEVRTMPTDRDANAEFIVRACNAHDDLLAALKDLLAWANIHDDGTGRSSDQALCVARNARDAIAKAERSTP